MVLKTGQTVLRMVLPLSAGFLKCCDVAACPVMPNRLIGGRAAGPRCQLTGMDPSPALTASL